jgi:hypothetical protein
VENPAGSLEFRVRETCHARRATSMLPFPTSAGAVGDGALAVRFAHQVLQA